MIHPALVFVASLPLIFRLVAFVVPDQWLEPYAYWSAAQLNTRSEGDDLKPRWRNVGWWQVGAWDSAISIIVDSSDRRQTTFRKPVKHSRGDYSLLPKLNLEETSSVRLVAFCSGAHSTTLDIGHGAGESLRKLSPKPARDV